MAAKLAKTQQKILTPSESDCEIQTIYYAYVFDDSMPYFTLYIMTKGGENISFTDLISKKINKKFTHADDLAALERCKTWDERIYTQIPRPQTKEERSPSCSVM